MAGTTTIQVVPYDLTDLTVGEKRQIQILTKAYRYSVKIDNEAIASYDEWYNEVTALAVGKTFITFTAYDKNDVELSTFSINIKVAEENTNKNLKYMFHNRASNRLNTMYYNKDLSESKTFTLPGKSGTLLIKENMATDNTYFLSAPIITSPGDGDVNVSGYMECTEVQLSKDIDSSEYEGTYWEFATDYEFSNIIDTRSIIRYPTNRCPIIHIKLTVYVRCYYVAGNKISEPSNVIHYTPNFDPKDSLRDLIAGDGYAGYFGIVPHEELIDNRFYRGNWETLDKYQLYDFDVGHQVHITSNCLYASDGTVKDDTTPNSSETVMYYALQPMNSKNIVAPDVSVDHRDGFWAIDNRENLPTPRWVNEVTGIGFGWTDSNGDTFSSGSTAIGAMVDAELGWLKYVYKGKLCYTPVKPICTQLCWCDIAKRDIAFGERTFRAGTQMYRIRLMREDEFLTIIPKLMNGELASFSQADLGLVDATDATKGRACWLEDFREGPLRKLGDNTGTMILEADPKMRMNGLTSYNGTNGINTWLMSYRPVIEVVTEYDEPWRNLPLSPSLENEVFQYDRLTDTGFLGRIPSNQLINGTELALKMSLVDGTIINQNCDWFKFYWHGLILYTATMPMRYYISANIVNNVHGLVSYNTGGNKDSVPVINIRGHRLNTETMIILSTDPIYQGGSNAAINFYGNFANYSQWKECMYRAYGCSDGTYSNYGPTGSYASFTYRLSDGDTWFTAGRQIGDNWERYLDVKNGTPDDTTSLVRLMAYDVTSNDIEASRHRLTNSMYNRGTYGVDMLWVYKVCWHNVNAIDYDDWWRPQLRLVRTQDPVYFKSDLDISNGVTVDPIKASNSTIVEIRTSNLVKNIINGYKETIDMYPIANDNINWRSIGYLVNKYNQSLAYTPEEIQENGYYSPDYLKPKIDAAISLVDGFNNAMYSICSYKVDTKDHYGYTKLVLHDYASNKEYAIDNILDTSMGWKYTSPSDLLSMMTPLKDDLYDLIAPCIQTNYIRIDNSYVRFGTSYSNTPEYSVLKFGAYYSRAEIPSYIISNDTTNEEFNNRFLPFAVDYNSSFINPYSIEIQHIDVIDPNPNNKLTGSRIIITKYLIDGNRSIDR